jgi:AraC-like DNA-binding protein
LMYRDLLGFEQERAEFASWLEPPRPALTLMVDLDGAIRADRDSLPDAWFGGLADTYDVVEFGPTYASIDLELTPLGAYQILGRPVSSLEGAVVALDDLFGVAGRVLAERLRSAPGWDERFDLLEDFLLARAAVGPRPTPAVEWAFARVRASAGSVKVSDLAAEIGCSRRYLTERFRAEVGLPPKTVARLTRFEHVCRRLRGEPAHWAEIAVDAGYCDQSHLNREFRELAGTTPGDFIARCIPHGGVVGDEVPFLQDA